MATVHLDPDVVRPNSLRGQVVIVSRNPDSGQNCLTRRKRDVLYLIMQGKTNKQIERSLGLGDGGCSTGFRFK